MNNLKRTLFWCTFVSCHIFWFSLQIEHVKSKNIPITLYAKFQIKNMYFCKKDHLSLCFQLNICVWLSFIFVKHILLRNHYLLLWVLLNIYFTKLIIREFYAFHHFANELYKVICEARIVALVQRKPRKVYTDHTI